MRSSRLMLGVSVAAALAACDIAGPTLPVYEQPSTRVWLNQGWTPEVRDRYHQADQGTLTFGIPYEWFAALEQPGNSDQGARLADPTYLDKFGFIPGKNGLPVGFARSAQYYDPTKGATWNNPATQKPYAGLGFTCAACHTGRITYKGTEFLIDGGSAMTHVGNFRTELGLALLTTDTNPAAYERFANRVLGSDAGIWARAQLHEELNKVVLEGLGEQTLVDRNAAKSTDEGFGRLDAINRIGNQVFGQDTYPALPYGTNYEAYSAPVHYPHIWDASWFSWVQYNGSIMQPMVRNAGEALGVRALVNVTNTERPLFESTVQVGTLEWIEHTLAGDSPRARKAFNGLRSPAWPAAMPPIDGAKAARGATLYKELCQGCHLPPTNTDAFWTGPWWKQIEGKGDRYVDLHQIPINEIGTDPAQAVGMANRTVALPASFNNLPDGQKFTSNGFGLALGQLVQDVTNHWYDTQTPPVSAARRDVMNGGRPNLLRVKLEYKARPLDGIWASPPYLHNGAVPTLYALLSPVAERPKRFTLGGREYDPVNAGYRDDAIAGGFVLDTSRPGNSNAGHEFRDAPKGGGVIGRGLSPEERLALIEYLKTL
jgi:mono/diheme cytochrome c family protein